MKNHDVECGDILTAKECDRLEAVDNGGKGDFYYKHISGKTSLKYLNKLIFNLNSDLVFVRHCKEKIQGAINEKDS